MLIFQVASISEKPSHIPQKMCENEPVEMQPLKHEVIRKSPGQPHSNWHAAPTEQKSSKTHATAENCRKSDAPHTAVSAQS